MLRAEDVHHLQRVLRLRAGEAVAVSDGAGSWAPGEWTGAGVSPIGPVVCEPPPAPPVAVGLVPTKGDRPEWAVAKLTELGADRIVVLSSARSVVRWSGERAGRHLAKLDEVARQAGMQSRRTRLPAIEGVTPVADLAGAPGWVMAVPGGPPLVAGPAPAPGPGPAAGLAPGPGLAPGLARALAAPLTGQILGVLVGPEGGWAPEERSAAGAAVVGLGPHVMRAETAALAAAALLAALRAGVVGPAG